MRMRNGAVDLARHSRSCLGDHQEPAWRRRAAGGSAAARRSGSAWMMPGGTSARVLPNALLLHRKPTWRSDPSFVPHTFRETR
eukprot:scaffold434_cov186-Pinguiococcus_pyrenoidosus.AAC.103